MNYLSVVLNEPSTEIESIIASFKAPGLTIHILLLCRNPPTFHDKMNQAEPELNACFVTRLYLSEPMTLPIMFYFGRLAKYRRLLFWFLDTPIHPADLTALLESYSPTTVVGFAGCSLHGVEALRDITWLEAKTAALPADFLDSRVLLIDRNALSALAFAAPRQNFVNADIKLNQCLHASGLLRYIIPYAGSYPLTKPQWTGQDQVDFVYRYLNAGFIPKKWKEINYNVLPTVSKGTHLTRLHRDNQNAIVVLGCQRSGTTWLNQVLGQTVTGILSLSENQTFDYLLDGLYFPTSLAPNLALQTTFMVSERESYLQLPETSLAVFMLRHPLSVCWSLLYHFNALDMVWAARRGHLNARVSTRLFDLSPIHKAIALYVDSLETAQCLLRERPASTIIISYEHMVQQPNIAIREILRKLSLIQPNFKGFFLPEFSIHTKKAALEKYRQLSEVETNLINRGCLNDYLLLKSHASNADNYQL